MLWIFLALVIGLIIGIVGSLNYYVTFWEGIGTTASGECSHAEGEETTASGPNSHAEGIDATASGKYSHAEGEGTIAADRFQHVQGQYNIEDASTDEYSNSKYAHIVGNGSYNNRSNAHTLDWEGNAWFAGDIYVGGTGQDDPNAKTIVQAVLDALPIYNGEVEEV